MKDKLGYTTATIAVLIIAAIPVFITLVLFWGLRIETRYGLVVSLILSLFMIPLWIAISDVLEILFAFITKNRIVTEVLSLISSGCILAFLYKIFLVDSWKVSIWATAIICCALLATKKYVDKNYIESSNPDFSN